MLQLEWLKIKHLPDPCLTPEIKKGISKHIKAMSKQKRIPSEVNMAAYKKNPKSTQSNVQRCETFTLPSENTFFSD